MYVITELNLKGIQKQVCIDEMHKRRKTFRKYLASFTPEVNITYNLSFHAFIKPESDSTGLNQFFKSVFKVDPITLTTTTTITKKEYK